MGKTFTKQQLAVTQSFGDRLAQERREKAARDRCDISQKDVAEAVGSSAPSVSRWEKGGPPPSDATLERLARYFGVTMGWLRYGQEPRRAPDDPFSGGVEFPRSPLHREILEDEGEEAERPPSRRAAGGSKKPKR